MKIMERKYISKNGVVETTRFAVGDNTRRFKGKRTGTKCTLKKQTDNDKLAVRRLARILNCNMNKHDLLLTLTWEDAALDRLMERVKKTGICEQDEGWMDALRLAADHEAALYQRRIVRKSALHIRMAAVTADMDGETGEVKRVHSHIVMTRGISWDLLQSEWHHGSVSIRELRDQDDYTPVAVYMLKQVRRVPEKNKYRVTRNMEKPKIEEREITGTAPIRLPRGAKLLERQYDVEVIGQYVRYKRKKSERDQRGEPKGAVRRSEGTRIEDV